MLHTLVVVDLKSVFDRPAPRLLGGQASTQRESSASRQLHAFA